jgi:outer membrane protein
MRQLVALALFVALLIGAGPAGAQEPFPPAVAAVINYQRVMAEAKAPASIRDQVDARRKVLQDAIAKERQRLVTAEKELAKQRAVLSAEAFDERRGEFDKKVDDVEKSLQERGRRIERQAASALNEVRDAIIRIVGGLSEERGFNIVLPSSGVLLFSPRVDLTRDVIARLDGQLPDVKVPETVGQN